MQPILEGIVTTLNADDSVNVSPMGPRVGPAVDEFELRPFRTSTTFGNLQRHGEGVLHVVDDVELLARAAISQWDPPPNTTPCQAVRGAVLTNCCRWYAFRVITIDEREARATLQCSTIDRGRVRDFFGFNRAKHAVLEAAILATRLHLRPTSEIRQEFARLAVIVEKTAGVQERRGFQLLTDYLEAHVAGAAEVQS